MKSNDDFVCRTFKPEDERQVKTLVKNTFEGFLDGEFWTWKYKLNPNFNPALVMVAEKDGVIVGCNHWLLKKFMLSPTLEAKAILGADIAVRPEFRGNGVGTLLLRALRQSEEVKAEKPLVSYIFADPALAKHFHTPSGGYIPAPDKTVSYFKILNWKKFKESAVLLNEQLATGKLTQKLPQSEQRVLFKIAGTPPLKFCMSNRGITFEDAQTRKADITISGSLQAFQAVRSAKKKRSAIIKALLTLKLRVKGSPRQLLSFYRNVWLIQEILSRKIT